MRARYLSFFHQAGPGVEIAAWVGRTNQSGLLDLGE
jgi:hypothetical protein